ncbi:hypothetical protein ACGFWE_20160 [Streptomyces sp. NPDC048523]
MLDRAGPPPLVDWGLRRPGGGRLAAGTLPLAHGALGGRTT